MPHAKYEVRVAGPDDLFAFDTELDAHRHANAINKVYLDDLLKNPGNEVLCVATVHATPAAGATKFPAAAPKDCPLCKGEGVMFNSLCTRESCGYYADAQSGAAPALPVPDAKDQQ